MEPVLDFHIETFDTLRYLVLMEGGIVLGLAAFVFRLYSYTRTLAERQARSLGQPVAGASPFHVAMVSLSHCVLVLMAMILVTTQLGEDFVWYVTPLAGVAFTLSLYSLVDIVRYENSRLLILRQKR